MKFDLGETRAEMLARKEKWHKWFAWRPVRVGPHDYRWLEFVCRQGHYQVVRCHLSKGFWTWQYRPFNRYELD